MSFDYIRKLPTPDEIREQYPVPDSLVPIKQKRDAEIRDVLTGKSDKLLVIIGPCSADNEDAVCDYINRLAKVNDKVSDRLILIPRIYTNKPRTTGDGYKGIVHQPDPGEKAGFRCTVIIAMRHMHIRALSERPASPLPTKCSIPENLGLCIRYPVLCGNRCPQRGGPAAPSDGSAASIFRLA